MVCTRKLESSAQKWRPVPQTNGIEMARTIERAWVNEAAAGGLIGGVAYMVFALFAGLVTNGVDGLFMPLRMIGAMVLGEQALQPSYPVAIAAVFGAVIHACLSVSFALTFVALAQPVGTIRSTNTLLLTASTYGLVLWLVNFYVVAPLFGWQWFEDRRIPSCSFSGIRSSTAGFSACI
jgi:hypothetical protein